MAGQLVRTAGQSFRYYCFVFFGTEIFVVGFFCVLWRLIVNYYVKS